MLGKMSILFQSFLRRKKFLNKCGGLGFYMVKCDFLLRTCLSKGIVGFYMDFCMWFMRIFRGKVWDYCRFGKDMVMFLIFVVDRD